MFAKEGSCMTSLRLGDRGHTPACSGGLQGAIRPNVRLKLSNARSRMHRCIAATTAEEVSY